MDKFGAMETFVRIVEKGSLSPSGRYVELFARPSNTCAHMASQKCRTTSADTAASGIRAWHREMNGILRSGGGMSRSQ
jgi:hypothetical protein